ncbi:MAG: hypothetical protein SVY10_17480 [Thermodesulfobacteriota bacterium]|nr:hypothetical protein [Thermodesulfobacteriota bacterium]
MKHYSGHFSMVLIFIFLIAVFIAGCSMESEHISDVESEHISDVESEHISDEESEQTSDGDLSGTWKMYHTEHGTEMDDEGPIVILHSNNTLFLDSCGFMSWNTNLIVSGDHVEGSWVDSEGFTCTLIGTITTNNMEISGAWSDTGGAGGEWRLEKISDSTSPISMGSLFILGDFCGESISIDTSNVCAFKDTADGVLDDIEIDTSYDGGWIGIEIETPDLLSSDTEFDVEVDQFKIDLQGDVVKDCFGYQDLGAESGTVTIEIYDGEKLSGSFDLMFHDGSYISGSFDLELESPD